MKKIIEPHPEEVALIKSVAGVTATEFLKVQWNASEAKIRVQENDLKHNQPARKSTQLGSNALLEAYHHEKEVIEALMDDAQDEILVNALYRRLDFAKRRQAAHSRRRPISAAEDDESRRARRERAILMDLLWKWNQWVRR
jgi:hypothetical protein